MILQPGIEGEEGLKEKLTGFIFVEAAQDGGMDSPQEFGGMNLWSYLKLAREKRTAIFKSRKPHR